MTNNKEVSERLGMSNFHGNLSSVNIPGGVISREAVHVLGRYPGRNWVTYRYEMDHVIDGASSNVGWSIIAYGLYRQAYWWQSPGDGRYYINIQYMDGSTWSSGEIYMYVRFLGFDNLGVISHRRSGIAGNKPIRKVTLGFIAELKSNSYHDVGDRSPGFSWRAGDVLTTPLTNAGFNLFEIPYTYSYGGQNDITDRLRKYNRTYGAATIAPIDSQSYPPSPLRIT